jgi:hypothetical protein
MCCAHQVQVINETHAPASLLPIKKKANGTPHDRGSGHQSHSGRCGGERKFFRDGTRIEKPHPSMFICKVKVNMYFY